GVGADQVRVGVGNLDAIASPVAFFGGAGSGATADLLVLNDSAISAPFNYLVTPASVVNNGGSRTFAGVSFDGSVEVVQLDGTQAANLFSVQPSTTALFQINGNSPAPGSVNGDRLELINLNAGRLLTLSSTPGSGRWTFSADSGLDPVAFTSMEQFDQVGALVTSADAGRSSRPLVRVYDEDTRNFRFEFFAFERSFRGGVRTAIGDVNGDGVPDIAVASGAGRRTEVRVFDGASNGTVRLASFRPFGRSTAGATVAFGDVNGDFRPDLIVGSSGGTPRVKVFLSRGDGTFLARSSFLAFESAFRGGVNVAAGDFNGDGRDEVLAAPGMGRRPFVRIIDGMNGRGLRQMQVFRNNFRGGVNIAAGDFNGDGVDDVLVGTGNRGDSVVRAFNGNLGSRSFGDRMLEFKAYTDRSDFASVHVEAKDVDGDGVSEIVTAQG
ncbi:MAG: FG-GAP repeat domain-containing protein, partial [Planctomycetia bacterium]